MKTQRKFCVIQLVKCLLKDKYNHITILYKSLKNNPYYHNVLLTQKILNLLVVLGLGCSGMLITSAEFWSELSMNVEFSLAWRRGPKVGNSNLGSASCIQPGHLKISSLYWSIARMKQGKQMGNLQILWLPRSWLEKSSRHNTQAPESKLDGSPCCPWSFYWQQSRLM